jgi:hypothetical protein
MFTIEDARRVQRDLGLGHAHVYYVDHPGFVLAHTDAERAAEDDLEACFVHRNLCEGTDLLPLGWYCWTPGVLKGLAL